MCDPHKNVRIKYVVLCKEMIVLNETTNSKGAKPITLGEVRRRPRNNLRRTNEFMKERPYHSTSPE